MIIPMVPICTWSRDFEAGIGEDLGVTKAVDFIREEYQETEKAIVNYTLARMNLQQERDHLVKFKDDDSDTGKLEREMTVQRIERHEQEEAHYGNETIDGFCDVIFVAVNGLYKLFRARGLDHDESMKRTGLSLARVVKANDAKRQPDGSVKREDNKVVKPEGWTPPFHGDLL